MYGCSGDSYSAGTVEGFTAQTDRLDKGLAVRGTTMRVPDDKQVPALPVKNWTFGNNVEAVRRR